MKANKAPEKIYLIRNFTTSTSLNTTNDCCGKYLHEWYKSREKDADVEYIRTDVVIKKVSEFIKERFYFEDSWHVKGDISILDKIIGDFKKYVEEQE